MGARSFSREPRGRSSLSPLRASRRCARAHGTRDAPARATQGASFRFETHPGNKSDALTILLARRSRGDQAAKRSPGAGHLRRLPIINLEEPSMSILSRRTVAALAACFCLVTAFGAAVPARAG